MNGPSSNALQPKPTDAGDIPPVFGPGAPAPAAVRPKGRPEEFVVFHDNAIPLWSQWDVPSALAALDAHALGQFYQSSLLSDAMGIDDALDAVVQTRILGLISRPFQIRASKKGKPKAAENAFRIIKDRWDEIFPEDVLSGLMHAYLLMGFSPAQAIWKSEGRLWLPTIQPWHPSTIYFDVPTRHYVANTMEGPAYIRPGDGRWMLLTPFGSYRGWMRGAVRAVVIPFLARQYALRDWARYNEVHGLPIKLAKAPANAQGDDKQTFLAGIANLGNESTVLLPQGVGDKDNTESYGLELLEAKADTYKAFRDIVSKCEERMAIRLLGQNLTTSIDAGSFAAANVHDRVRLDYVRFDSKALGAIREQVLRAFCQFNFGDPDLAPDIAWDCSPPEDNTARMTSLAQLGAAMVNFAQVQAPVDMRKLLESADIPCVAGGPLTPTMKAEPAPGGAIAKPKKAAPLPPAEKKETQRLDSIDARLDAIGEQLDDPAEPIVVVDPRLDVLDQHTASIAAIGDQVSAIGVQISEKPETPAVPARQYAERNAAFFADIKDMRSLGLVVDQATVDRLAEKHDVMTQRLEVKE